MVVEPERFGDRGDAGRLLGAVHVAVAVPVAPRSLGADLRAVADEVVCLREGNRAGRAAQPDEQQVEALLAQAKSPPPLGLRRVLRSLDEGYGELFEQAAAADFVLIGAATQGTHEFYAERAKLTKRLIAEAGFTAVAVEADWPDAGRVDRYVRGASEDRSADQALDDFRRFPAWLWRNTVMQDFVEWLKTHNDVHAPKAGFYGLDLYSLRASIEAVLAYLNEVDPEAAARARERYACFDHAGRDPEAYGYQAALTGGESCEHAAVEVLMELRERRAAAQSDDAFFAEQNAALVVHAEEYYRELFRSSRRAWNLRETHMAGTLDALVAHLECEREPVKVVVWAHNPHVGDARATELGRRGELSLGQLVRTRHGADALLVGMTTYTGTVTAATDWDRPAERKRVRPALRGSWEEVFHHAGRPRALIDPGHLNGRRLERAIGVIYRPQIERLSHYFSARLHAQFDAVLHLDETTALEPLDP